MHILVVFAPFGNLRRVWQKSWWKQRTFFAHLTYTEIFLMHNFAFLCLLGYFLHNLCIPFKKYISTFWLLLKGHFVSRTYIAIHSWNKAVWKPKGFTGENCFQQISRKRLVWEQSLIKRISFYFRFWSWSGLPHYAFLNFYA